MKKFDLKIGDKISIKRWIVEDQTENKSTATDGFIISEVENVKVSVNEGDYPYNHYLMVRLSDGIEECFNADELTKKTKVLFN